MDIDNCVVKSRLTALTYMRSKPAWCSARESCATCAWFLGEPDGIMGGRDLVPMFLNGVGVCSLSLVHLDAGGDPYMSNSVFVVDCRTEPCGRYKRSLNRYEQDC